MLANFAILGVLLLGLAEAAPLPKCRWNYGKYYQTSLRFLDQMAANATEDVENPLPFPKDQYELESKRSVKHRLTFVADLLQEVQDLFDHKNISSASWDETTLEHFLAVVYREKVDLQDCVSRNRILVHMARMEQLQPGSVKNSKNQTLQKYFKELSRMVLEEKEYSAEAWEMIRTEVKLHLFRASQLIPSKMSI
ncbi:interferon a3-like [Nerophis ophidion]|uniref:interferon a3-like n=1 Tax=Nerophis ophidion TaxID=159077 RepID=UPI002AE03626|nr:interferon a3-like [Nerophis ophidion]